MGRWTLAACVLSAAASAQAPGTVLSEQKISAQAGGFTGAASAADHFAHALAPLGDLDRDGVNDLAVGAPDDDDGGSNRGAVWLLLLNAEGTVRLDSKISAAGTFPGALDAQDHFGSSLAVVGDLDGNGVVELAVGAEGDDDGGLDRGAVWILTFDPAGGVPFARKISQTSGGFGGALRDGDRFGRSLAGLGDLDGDGVADLAVGADLDDDGGSNRGAVWILFLNRDGTVRAQSKLSSTQGGFGPGLDDGDFLGRSVARLGDLDLDFLPELAIGASEDDDEGFGAGAVWIVSLARDGSARWRTKIANGLSLTSFDRFGTSSAGPGDLDGDGVPDLAAGATGDDDGGLNAGAVWNVFLRRDGTLKDAQKISATQGGFGGALDRDDNLGCALTALGDLDGDGQLDLVAGAEGDDDGGLDVGAAWVLFLDGRAPANPVVRNGSGINRVLLTASGPPRLGRSWDATVDCRGHQPGFVLHFGTDAPASGPVVPVLGEWLVDFFRPRLFQRVVPHAGTPTLVRHSVPFDLTLIDLEFYSQAVIVGRPAPELSNALDGRVVR